MKIGINTSFDCVLDISGQKYEMIKNNSHIEIDLQKDEEVFLLFYPVTSADTISYASKIKLENENLKVDCPHVKTIKDNLGNYELNFLPFSLFDLAIKKIYKTNLQGYELKILQADKNFVSFDDGGEVYFENFFGEINSYEFFTLSNNPCILIKLDDEQKLFVFNTQSSSIDKFFGQIEIKDEIISVISEKNDFAKHAVSKEYKYDQGVLTIVANDLLYQNQKPQITKNLKIVPFAFFEAVKEKNFLLAKEYLSEELVRNVTQEILEEYFGDFEKIKPYNFQIDKGYFINVINGNSSKVFRINMLNGKINEIELQN